MAPSCKKYLQTFFLSAFWICTMYGNILIQIFIIQSIKQIIKKIIKLIIMRESKEKVRPPPLHFKTFKEDFIQKKQKSKVLVKKAPENSSLKDIQESPIYEKSAISSKPIPMLSLFSNMHQGKSLLHKDFILQAEKSQFESSRVHTISSSSIQQFQQPSIQISMPQSERMKSNEQLFEQFITQSKNHLAPSSFVSPKKISLFQSPGNLQNKSLLLQSNIKSKKKKESSQDQQIPNLLPRVSSESAQKLKNRTFKKEKKEEKLQKQKVIKQRQDEEIQWEIKQKQQDKTAQKKTLDPLALLFGPKAQKNQTTQKQKLKLKQQERLKQKSAQSILMKWLGGENKSFQTLRDRLKNQKNLKLKDYLRLTSLSNESRYKKIKKGNKQSKHSTTQQHLISSSKVSSRVSSRGDHKKQKHVIIDSETSIKLIKQSINKKFKKTIKSSVQFLKQLEKEEIVGSEYEDLVFMCNMHQIFDDNVFQSYRAIKEIFVDYKRKKQLNKITDQHDFIDEILKTILKPSQMSSPTKKKKKGSNLSPQNLTFKLTSLILSPNKKQ